MAAEVTAIAEKEAKFKADDGSVKMRVEFSFVITEPDLAWDGQRIWGDTPTTFTTNPDCKLRAWSTEILGDELGPGFALDTDLLVGMPCRIVVGAREYQQNNMDKVHNFVKDVIRAKGAAIRPLVSNTNEEPF
jgi:hypothetical protein